MPHGFFTIEQWVAQQKGSASQWIPILHLDSYQSLTKAMTALKRAASQGSIESPRCNGVFGPRWKGGRLRLHGSHASSPENLAQVVDIFDREGGRRPIEDARKQRALAKANRSKE